MSFQDPGTDAQLDQDIAVPTPRQRNGRGRRYVATIAAAALSAAAVGAGVWAWRSFMDQGAQPAQALPASTLAYASLDLDPPGGQKVEAFKALQKFPSIKKELGLDSVDDVQKSVVDELTSNADCALSYATFKPWLGDRMAAAVVPLKKPEAVVVLQVADTSKAQASLDAKSTECHFGFTIKNGWAILARNKGVALQVQYATTTEGTLDSHPDYKRLTSAAGDPGIVAMYAAPEAGQALLNAVDDDPYSAYFILSAVNSALDPVTGFVFSFGVLAFAGSDVGYASSSADESGSMEPKLTAEQQKEEERINSQYEHYEDLTPAQQKALDAESQDFYTNLFKHQQGTLSATPGSTSAGSGSASSSSTGSEGGDSAFADGPDQYPQPEVPEAIRDSLKHFTGLGGIGRISDGTVEVEIVGDQLVGTSASMYGGSKAKDQVANLPKDSAIAFGAGLADGWVDALFTQLSTQFVFSGNSKDRTIKSFEKATGLDVPQDLEALGGNGVSFVTGPGFSPDGVFDHPEQAQVAARLTGDPDKIEAALDKLRSHTSNKLLSRRDGDAVLVSGDKSYLDDLAGSGGLSGSDTFDQVVPDADHAASIFFINFDSGDWLVKQMSGNDREDAKPLHGFGMSVTKNDNGQQHIRIRLSFD
ncbi:MAG: DUF3352 domain-containing protein [Marmoricola sp.]